MEVGLTRDIGRWLPVGHNSLAFGVRLAEPGAVYALGFGGGYAVGPGADRVLYFGRNRLDVHVCVGEGDQQISRRHGALTHRAGRWWVSNTGQRPIRLPRSQWLFTNAPAIPLPEGYTPLFLAGSWEREHLLEVYVAGPLPHDDAPRAHHLSADERLILIVLGQRYLLHEASPKPLTWRQAADQLAALQPSVGWTSRKVEHRVAAVRSRLTGVGVSDLTREEVGEPVGNSLNDNLLKELVRSTTLVPPDLAALDNGQ